MTSKEIQIIDIVNTQDRNSDLLNKLTELWRHSVSQTHSFLSNNDIDEIEKFVPEALKNVEYLIVVCIKNNYLGFMGIEKQRLEMLFLDPQYIGQKIGRMLLEYGFNKYHINEVTVNEQNPHAVGFYNHFGFEIYKRSELDEQGRPFPLLYMKKINA